MINRPKRSIFTLSVVLLLMLLLVLSMANLWLGSVYISPEDVWLVITGKASSPQTSVIIWEYRMPQVFTAIATGMGLSIAGLLLQTVFRNPLAGPSVLGISAGASLGVAVVVLAGSVFGTDILQNSVVYGDVAIVTAAFAGALTIMAAILYVSGKTGNVVTVLIIGIMIGYAVSAVVGVLQFFSGSEELHAYVLWGLGSFAKNTLIRSEVVLAATLILVVSAIYVAIPLNAMLLGEHYARSIGFNLKKYNSLVLLIAGLLIALGTAFTGPIAFLGLAVPHLARSLFNTSNHKILLPATLLIGADMALLCNLTARLPGLDTSLPINAVTSVIGAPVVIWVIVKRSKFKVS